MHMSFLYTFNKLCIMSLTDTFSLVFSVRFAHISYCIVLTFHFFISILYFVMQTYTFSQQKGR